MPELASDWLCQRELARILGITEQTACLWARQGKLRPFEHGLAIAGRNKYSRRLVERHRRKCWQEAVARQDRLMNLGRS